MMQWLAVPVVCSCAAAGAAQVELIPRELLVGYRIRSDATLSPDGRHVAYLAHADSGANNIWLMEADAPGSERPITFESQRGIHVYQWAMSSDRILYESDDSGDERWRTHVLDLATGISRPLRVGDADARALATSPTRTDEIIVAAIAAGPRAGIFRMNLRTGETVRVRGGSGWFDAELRPVMLPGSGWHGHGLHEDLFSEVLSVSADGRQLFVMTAGDAGYMVIDAIDARGARTTFASIPDADVYWTIDAPKFAQHVHASLDPITRVPQAVGFGAPRRDWLILDAEVQADFAWLEERLSDPGGGQFSVLSRSLDDSRWLVQVERDDAPPDVFLYERAREPSASRLFSACPELAEYPMARMVEMHATARDGLSIPCLVSVSPWLDGDGDGLPDEPAPTVVLIHGGPWSRYAWGFDPEQQFLANRGYVVLAVNFRGSSGYGVSYMNAGDRQWGGAMIDDVVDATREAIARGIADHDRIALVGRSYGGYATMIALARYPDLFACGVAMYGPTDLVEFVERYGPSEFTRNRIGDARSRDGRRQLEAGSPILRARDINDPILMTQGANDPRVMRKWSDDMASALDQLGNDVTYVLFPDEGHRFLDSRNNQAWWAAVEAFLARHLGGRQERLRDSIQRSSARIVIDSERLIEGNAAVAP